MTGLGAAVSVDDPRLARHGDADALSLALIDARNHTLRWLAAFEAAGALHAPNAAAAGRTPLVLAADAAVWPARWILDTEPGAPPADAQALRLALATLLDETLERLAATPPDALHAFRAALRHEDALAEALAEAAAEASLPDGGDAAPPWRPLAGRAPREPLWFPPQRMRLGAERGGSVPAAERWAHELAVPEFEIDALPVSWSRFVEFADDGGYDRRELWSEAGWAWLQAQGRRAPRHVEQLKGGVLVSRRGRMQRVPPAQPLVHVTRHEAEAWCRWVGRRLPTEPEWELAARAGRSRGFAWGEVWEWCAGSARPWPGHEPAPDDPMPAPGSAGVLRGASWMTRDRQRHATVRRFAAPDSDTMFCGFRSCAA